MTAAASIGARTALSYLPIAAIALATKGQSLKSHGLKGLAEIAEPLAAPIIKGIRTTFRAAHNQARLARDAAKITELATA